MAKVNEVRLRGRQYGKLKEMIEICRKEKAVLVTSTQASVDMVQARAPDIEVRVARRKR